MRRGWGANFFLEVGSNELMIWVLWLGWGCVFRSC